MPQERNQNRTLVSLWGDYRQQISQKEVATKYKHLPVLEKSGYTFLFDKLPAVPDNIMMDDEVY